MKRIIAISICCLLLLALCTGCAANAAPEAEAVEIVVFAAASMTETLSRIVELYQSEAPGVTVTLNLESSGTLKTQIQEGAVCDLFISAAQKQMNALDASKGADVNPECLDFVLQGSRIDLLENKVALVVPAGNPANINSFSDIANCGSIALGNSDVPVGQYSIEILENLGFLKDLEYGKRITYGSNVKEVTTHVLEGVVDCGIVYATDAFSAGLTVADQADQTLCRQVVYPAAVIKSGTQPKAAQAFLDYLQTPNAAAVFTSVGFAMANE